MTMALMSVISFLICLHCALSGPQNICPFGNDIQHSMSDGSAKLAEFPWVVRVRVFDGKGWSTATGSLISSRHVLTVAQMFTGNEKRKDVKVILGEYDTRTFPDDCTREDGCIVNQLIYPDMILPHPDYSQLFRSDDIALLRLEKKPLRSYFIKPISLPYFDIDKNSFGGCKVAIAGWNINERHILQKTLLNLIPKNQCEKKFLFIPSGHLCAGDKNVKNMCAVNAGSPLMMSVGNEYYLSGLSSYALDQPCETLDSAFFTNVFKYNKWIQDNMIF